MFVLAGIGAAFWFIHEFAVNTVINDQFTDVNIIRMAHSGTLSLGGLWAQHNEARVLFPNLVVLALAYTTHFNVVVEDFLSLLLLLVTIALLVAAHRRRAPSMSWIWYVPAVLGFLMFDVLASALFGFLLSWFLVLVGLAVAIFVLDRGVLSWLGLAAAVAAAVVGSYSSLQGLLIWPAGLVLLYLRRHGKWFMLAWILSAMATTVLYFSDYDFNATGGDNSYVLHHPVDALKLFLFAIGDVSGVRTQPPGLHEPGWHFAVTVPGVVVLAIAVWAIVHGFRSGREGSSPVGVALTVFGLLFAAIITLGRLRMGVSNAPRYMTYEVTIWVGAYLALFDRPFDWSRSARAAWAERADRLLGVGKRPDVSTQARSAEPPVTKEERIDWVARCLLAICMLVAIVSGPYIGLIDARSWHTREVRVARVASHIDTASDATVTKVLGTYPAPFIRQMVAFERSQGLSQFAGRSGVTQPPGRTRDRGG